MSDGNSLLYFVLGALFTLIVLEIYLNLPLAPTNQTTVSFQTIKAFLSVDTTNFMNFNKTMICIDYAFTLRQHAKKVGINMGMAFVYFHFKGEKQTVGHALNFVILDNNTILFIEPQDDDIDVNLVNLLSRDFHGTVEIDRLWLIG